MAAPESAAIAAQQGKMLDNPEAPGPPANGTQAAPGAVAPAGAARARQLQVDCSARTSCGSCSSVWPTCAWCGTTGVCLKTSPEVVRLGSGSQHVVYSTEEYTKTYGSSDWTGTLDNRCGVWVIYPSSCSWVEGYCQRHRPSTCPECKQMGGCGYCHSDDGGISGCLAGSRSSPIRLTTGAQGCSSPTADWIFGNWSRYYTSNVWDASCLATCQRFERRERGTSGTIHMGDQGLQVYYAPESACSWEISPAGWSDGNVLEITMEYRSLAARGDLLRLYKSAPGYEDKPTWQGSELLGYVGCLTTTVNCVAKRTMVLDGPAVLTFSSVSRPVLSNRGVWSVSWRLLDSREEGIPIRSFVWMGLAMVIIPMLAVLLWVIWCRRRYRNQRGNFDSSLGREGSQQTAETVDIAYLERTYPECRPRIIGARNLESNEVDDDAELGSQGTPTCSVCLRELEEGDEARSLPCRHNFHRSCIDLWIRRSTKCPLCRQSVITPGTPASPETGRQEASPQGNTVQPTQLGQRISGPGRAQEADPPVAGARVAPQEEPSPQPQADPAPTNEADPAPTSMTAATMLPPAGEQTEPRPSG
mmetsp:Transcript_105089/g.313937  ORF Transcript_105089/g.313937 Transcript_105089/m.313937 type:complete len:587 (-) Transcript_105089:91-1851(-)